MPLSRPAGSPSGIAPFSQGPAYRVHERRSTEP
nr:MAG TPA: hypothetical protein [Caudoviricetes sp.]